MRAGIIILCLFSVISNSFAAKPSQCKDGACYRRFQMSHPTSNGRSRQVPLHVWYPAAVKSSAHLAVLMPGALVRAVDYTQFSFRLARAHGYVVVIPEYTGRVLDSPVLNKHIQKTIEKGAKCNKNGVISSAMLINSIDSFLSGSSWRRDMPRLRNSAILIGHSFGGFVASVFFFGSCRNGKDPSVKLSFQERVACEGYVGNSLTLKKTKITIRLLVTFDGGHLFTPSSRKYIPKGSGVVDVLRSNFGKAPSTLPDNLSRKHNSGKRALIVSLREKTANHFMLNDFEPTTSHSRTACALLMNKSQLKFKTTAFRQKKVVIDSADIVGLAFWSLKFRTMSIAGTILKGIPSVKNSTTVEDRVIREAKST